MKKWYNLINYLTQEKLVLATAESCTAGEIIATLAKEGNCGDCLYIGYLVYQEQAKIKQLGVNKKTINQFTLTSEEVAREMAYGAFQHEEINLTIATTGIVGQEEMDNIPPGTVCFAWGFKHQQKITIYSETMHFDGSPAKRTLKASHYALLQIMKYHQLFLKEGF
ncbi:CinA family protein [Legionella sp. km772]|uniref:CinA family protein n=1 Tax=Legionella sp. km772 TaxID=2498111 RepID=UPI000F8ED381|nr:nicotinamide-nucleotide amidohydrolase family protein [Legionella sp. km772]RUR07128.1 nicotinamide-nucleotide amidohydrolase family protein [Legionella sp. km772]